MAEIEIRDVCLNYDTPAGRVTGVQDVSLDIDRSEFLCLVGPSGCGKSTLLNIIAGFISPSGGEIRIGGKKVNGHGMDRGVVFQDFAQLFPWRTALGNVAFGLEMKGVPKDEREAIALEQLRLVKLEKFVKSYPHHLSGGMQQRVAIARALAMEPKLMLLDEPTSALDPEMINEVLDVMVQLAKDGMTMIAVTHEMGFARRAADRVLFMADGQIVEEATPTEFFDAPKSARAQDFLSKILSH